MRTESTASASASAGSDAVRLMLRPTAEYRSQMERTRDASWAGTLGTPFMFAVLLAVATVNSTTGRVTARLLISGVICWSFVPLLQLATAAVFIRAHGRRNGVSFARAIELWFLAHAPWSIWVLVVGATLPLLPVAIDWIAVASLIPTFWTATILIAFFREVGGHSRRSAILRTLTHQAVTWILILTYIELTTATSTRIIGAFQ